MNANYGHPMRNTVQDASPSQRPLAAVRLDELEKAIAELSTAIGNLFTRTEFVREEQPEPPELPQQDIAKPARPTLHNRLEQIQDQITRNTRSIYYITRTLTI